MSNVPLRRSLLESRLEDKDFEWIRFKRDTESLVCQDGESNLARLIPSSSVSRQRVGIALVGLGRMGTVHLRNIICEPRVRLMYCLDASLTRLNHIADQMYFDELDIKAWHSDRYDEVLSDDDVEVVMIVSPTYLHEFQVRKALVAGKNVLCEKPLTTETKMIEPLYRLANEQKRFLVCAFNRRYDPAYHRLKDNTMIRLEHISTTTSSTVDPKQLPTSSKLDLNGGNCCIRNQDKQAKQLDNNNNNSLVNGCRLVSSSTSAFASDGKQLVRMISPPVGLVQLIRITSRDCQRPSLNYINASGGLFHDSAIHDLDLALWYSRQLPLTVYVTGSTWQEHYKLDPESFGELTPKEKRVLNDIDDFYLAVITLKFPNGCVAVIDNSRQTSYGYDQRCEIFGTDGMQIADSKHALNHIEVSENGYLQAGINFNFASRFSDAYKNELQDLITMTYLTRLGIYNDKHKVNSLLYEPIRPNLVVATSMVADACIESAKTGQTVSINWSKEFRTRYNAEMQF